jgi:hypothetical protein
MEKTNRGERHDQNESQSPPPHIAFPHSRPRARCTYSIKFEFGSTPPSLPCEAWHYLLRATASPHHAFLVSSSNLVQRRVMRSSGVAGGLQTTKVVTIMVSSDDGGWQ